MFEDKDNIYLKSKDELKTLELLKCSEYASTSNLYKCNNEVLKVYHKKRSIDVLNTLDFIKNLKLKMFVGPNKFIFLDEEFYGYSMDYINGNILFNLSGININNLFKSLDYIEKDIKKLSDNKIEIVDLNCLNILYNFINNLINIVDLDEYTVRTNLSFDEIFKINIEEFINNFFLIITDCYDIGVSKESLVKLRNILNNYNKYSSLYDLFINIKMELENISDSKITRISDFRKCLMKK